MPRLTTKTKGRSVAAAALLVVASNAQKRGWSGQAETSSSVDSTRHTSVIAAAASR